MSQKRIPSAVLALSEEQEAVHTTEDMQVLRAHRGKDVHQGLPREIRLNHFQIFVG
jgi:hypothetical protein